MSKKQGKTSPRPSQGARRRGAGSSGPKSADPFSPRQPDSRRQPVSSSPSGSGFSGRTWLLLVLILVSAGGVWGYVQWMNRNLRQAERGDSGTRKTTRNDSSSANSALGAVTPAANRSWDQRNVDGSSVWVTPEKQCESWSEIDNPAEDGWSSEAFSSAAMKQFDKLKKLLTHAGHLDAAAVEFLTTPEVQVGRLRPQQLKTTFQDAVYHAQRAALGVTADDELARVTSVDIAAPAGEALQAEDDGAGPELAGEEMRTGRESFVEAFHELLRPYTDVEKIRMKIKVFNVEERSDGGMLTRQTLEVFGPTAEGDAEINSFWEALWQPGSAEPVLVSLKAKTFETVERKGELTFADCTAAALGANPSFQAQLLQGYNYWLDRRQFNMFFGRLGTPGMAVGDVNQDGLSDLYLCQEDGLPNLLYVQQPDGTLRDVSTESGADWLVDSRAALLVDLNNDGRKDLVVAAVGGVIVAEGDGQGKFALRTVLDSQDDVMNLSAADYDQDGWLDLYAGVYLASELRKDNVEMAFASGPVLLYDANNGGENSLWRNELGGANSSERPWSFRDVTESVGLDQNNQRFTLASGWEDIDNDGDLDLYVANDYGKNNLYRNDVDANGQRRFADIAGPAGAEDSNSGMSVSWADFDHDGWMDLYVSNMFSYAGNRIMYQNRFKPGTDQEILDQFRRFAKGNTLLRNLGMGESPSDSGNVQKFEDRSLQAAVNRGRWAWASRFVDINNDSWDDLVVANGFITTEDTGDL